MIAARDLAKLKTWSQAIAAAVGGLAAAGVWGDRVAWWALLVALVLTWVSGLDYARAAPGLLRGRSATVLSAYSSSDSSIPARHHGSGASSSPASASPIASADSGRLRRIRLRIHTKRVLRRHSIEGFCLQETGVLTPFG